MEKPMSNSTIPHTDSIEELAHFWDSHDVSDFGDQLEEVSETVFQREAVVNVHLPCKEADTIKEMARSQGLHDADLVRQWILERVHSS
jgi:hypothetical protein